MYHIAWWFYSYQLSIQKKISTQLLGAYFAYLNGAQILEAPSLHVAHCIK